MWFTSLFASIVRLFTRRKHVKLALYGPPNGGKTTLANRICADWVGEEMGTTNSIAHETRKIQTKERIQLVHEDGRTLSFSLVDTPGISSRIDYEDFVREGMDEKTAKQRAQEAARGVVESVEWLGNADCIVVVLDATKEPQNQVNTTLIANVSSRGIPMLLVANKIDLKKGSVDRVQTAFPQYSVLGISAKYGDNTGEFYERLFELTEERA